jgi:hypothetical protein
MMEMVDAALEYAAHRISIIPLHTPTSIGCSCAKGPTCFSPGKHPRVPWQPHQDHRATPEEIRAWWTRWPAANVGIVTGMISRVCVVDIDYRNGGFETLVELDHHGGVMPDDNPVDPLAALGAEIGARKRRKANAQATARQAWLEGSGFGALVAQAQAALAALPRPAKSRPSSLPSTRPRSTGSRPELTSSSCPASSRERSKACASRATCVRPRTRWPCARSSLACWPRISRT